MRKTFIIDLLRWIHSNLDRDISISEIVQRSGYSNAQLNRIFKSDVGCTLKEYVTNCRLQRCAIVLKFTSTPVHELASRYHYSNQQAFSRFFKSFYGVTPQEFRQSKHFDFHNLFAWKHRHEFEIAGCQVEFIHFEHLELVGTSAQYELSITGIGSPHTEARAAVEAAFQLSTQRPVDEIYTLCRPVKRGERNVCFDYHVGVEREKLTAHCDLLPLPNVTGDYLKFSFSNPSFRPYEYSAIAYWGFISTNGIKRRDGYDVEHFNFSHSNEAGGYAYTLYIPVLFDNSLIDALLLAREGWI
ncbi:helix-turn-helix domain-containing protein [Lelliottia wanjuensis]|uniref:Helix-turn-helix domain-containing protein n=1 Tax=Lelliottia wanjuensis TaxID=3050585 RepID=A0AAP4LC61_9ENTR|nr:MULTISPECIES: helix-turn-helix domain-containing protein [unclassified Lelliottia]MDK9365429.1 helix-turn-helix domain-containing protein [Lelliottia sp. V106_12]MDK9584414.1 helix-turn-helix domain-containing protein [Lelliottia sp. V86_10]MDK9617257.1 helix-turn-helix domain-containing protein [Lelliottia sp. V106_9]